MRLVEEPMKLLGRVKLTAYEGDPVRVRGKIVNPVVFEWEGENLITTAGKNLSLDRLYNALASMNGLTHTGVGTSATAAAIGDTGLAGAAWKAYDAAPVRSSQTVTSITTFTTAEANINIQEAALANGSGGTILNRIAPIGPFNKTTAVSLSVTIAVTQA